jgi:heme-degrading monooxygenase HmoA
VPIKVLIKRQFKKGHVNEIKTMLKEVPMDQEGYISSETMWDYENPFRVVVASNWRSIENPQSFRSFSQEI